MEPFLYMKVIQKKLISIQLSLYINAVLFNLCFGDTKQVFFPRNIELLSSVVTSITQKAVDCFDLNTGDRVFINEFNTDGKKERFICDCFYKELTGAGIHLFFNDDTSKKDLILSLIVTEANVIYKKYLGRSLFKQGYIVRRAELCMSFRIIDFNTGRLIWSGDLKDFGEDLVPVSHIHYIERGGEILGIIALPDEGGMRHWVEPIFALGVMGVVTVLFYLIRSS
jgi:hypothetical protein